MVHLCEYWTILHGMILGGVFLLLLPLVVFVLWIMRQEWLSVSGTQKLMRFLILGTWLIAIAGWLTDITGTYISYPWYRAVPPEGSDLARFPLAYLIADPRLAGWEEYGMEWKEHLAWFVPVLTTVVAYVVSHYGITLFDKKKIRNALIVFLIIAFAAGAIAGLIGALVTKVAPVH